MTVQTATTQTARGICRFTFCENMAESKTENTDASIRTSYGMGQIELRTERGNHNQPIIQVIQMSCFCELNPQPTHRKPMKTGKNKGFSALLHAMGQSVGVKTPIRL